jgi:DNA-binding IclR family transcriptional regulator
MTTTEKVRDYVWEKEGWATCEEIARATNTSIGAVLLYAQALTHQGYLESKKLTTGYPQFSKPKLIKQ